VSDQPRTKLPRRRWFLIALLIVPVVLIIGRLAWLRHLSDPSGQITIGRETTYLDGPVTQDGAIDYVAAVNQRESAGVTPENNAVVLLVQAYGPGLLGDGIRDRYLELLGGSPPAGGERFQNEKMFLPGRAPRRDRGRATNSPTSRRCWIAMRRRWR
jgi:hypothetical protein